MSTPIRNQYLRLKAQFPGAIMFFRLGDFYEMFDDDALTGSRELELTLTSREFARGERSPMCGVPYHAAENHIARLVARGYKVAICEQIGDPRTAKGLVDRHAHVDDRRRVTLVLTVKGQQTVAQADALIATRLGAIADFLSDEESARAFDGLLLWGRAQAAQAEARSVTPA